jgi:hypothetical protein
MYVWIRDGPEILPLHRDHQWNRTATDKILIGQIRKKKWENNETVHHIFINFTKAYDSATMEVLYNNLMELGVPMKLVRLIKMYSN